MNYIKNGNFEDGLTNWNVVQAPITIEKEGDRYHARFGRDAKLTQNWSATDKPTFVLISLEIRVINGSNQATGMVQGVVHSEGPAGPTFETFNINEYLDWRTFNHIVQLHGNTSRTLELVVQPNATNIVQMRNIAVIGSDVSGG
jgi:hypothetical protein